MIRFVVFDSPICWCYTHDIKDIECDGGAIASGKRYHDGVFPRKESYFQKG